MHFVSKSCTNPLMASRRYRDLFTTFSPLKNAFSLFLYELLILLLKKPRKPPTVLSSNLLLLGCPQQNLGGVHGRMEGRGQHFQETCPCTSPQNLPRLQSAASAMSV